MLNNFTKYAAKLLYQNFFLFFFFKKKLLKMLIYFTRYAAKLLIHFLFIVKNIENVHLFQKKREIKRNGIDFHLFYQCWLNLMEQFKIVTISSYFFSQKNILYSHLRNKNDNVNYFRLEYCLLL